MVCRFGDEESTSEVPCRIDETTNEILCERPRKRANLRDIKMKVKISEDEQQVALIQASGKKEKRERPSRCSSSQMCTRSILAAIVGEFIGTCLLTLVICTTVVVAVITGTLKQLSLTARSSLTALSIFYSPRCSCWSLAGRSCVWSWCCSQYLPHIFLL